MLLSVKEIHRVINFRSVLSGVSFDVSEGELKVISARSGQGKSLLCSTIAGTTDWDRGEIHFNNIQMMNWDSDDQMSARLQMGVLYQSPGVISNLTVTQNLMLAARAILLNLSERERSEYVTDLLEETGLIIYKDYRPIFLSSGELKLLAIARSLIGCPKLLLWDDPLIGLCETKINWVRDRLERRINEGGAAVIFSGSSWQRSHFKGETLELESGVIKYP